MKVIIPFLSLIALASAASVAHPAAAHHRKHNQITRSTGKAARCAAVKAAQASLSSASVASVSTVSIESTKSVHSVEATHTVTPKPKPAQDNGGGGNSDSGNGGGGDPYGGDLTFYEMGADACGGTDGPNDMVAAVAYRFFDNYPGAGPNPNNNPICGRKALVHWGGKSCVVRIVDKCMGCTMESLDLSPRAFEIFSDLGAGRLHGMTWGWA